MSHTNPVAGTPSTAPRRNTHFRYTIMSLIVLMTMINYIDRGAISYASEPIIRLFHLNESSWGEVLGYFGYGYMVGSISGGLLSDKKGPKFVWIVAGSLWSIFEILMAFAGNIGIAIFGGSALAGFAVIRILFGVSEGPLFSTMNKTVANWAANREKGFMQSFGLFGVPFGSLITAPIAVGLLSITNWQTTFVLLGSLGVIWVIVWARVFRNRPEEHTRVSRDELLEIRSGQGVLSSENTLTESEQQEIPWYHFFKNPTLVCNAIGYFAFQYVNFLILTWTPKYLQDTFHYSLSKMWYMGMIPWIGACITVMLGGKISDVLRRRTGNLRIARSGLAVLSLVLTAVCFLLIPTVHSIASVLLLMSIGNAFNFLPNSVYWAVVIDTEPSKAGSFGGVTHFITNIATVMAPTLTGFLVSAHGYHAMFIASAVASVIGMVAMMFVKPGKRVQSVIGNLEK
ncbi:MFS transporter [Alicyclobacillus fastidiosus]|uniref:MFS transporter n=1 Tax=Alicyclobacillus fastidiosus TaxID=392011 RepID=A0ABV5A931_9BACL|nr:MFS transporter [Alicyclobacillus fastidiosus]WEH10723.1 MFS transporter [Alicyclobacillus fastidiosus]